MPTAPLRTPRHAPEKNGRAENTMTGKVNHKLAQRISDSISAGISPSDRYIGSAYIMTCIMPNAATNRRHNDRRCSVLRCAAERRASNGSAW
jgi:hypothetical protein